MAKSSKPKKKSDGNIEANINIGGDVSNANIIVGHGNTINVGPVKTEYTLFTIPAPVKDFTGREAQIEKLKADFSRGVVISGISGGGGIGKTELARKLAQEIAEDFPDARLSIDLLGTSETPLSPEDVMRRLLEPLYPNQKLPDEPEQLSGLYQRTFKTKKALLLLDNALNAAQVRPLIPTSNSAAIVTSRNNFTLTGFGMSEPLQLDVLSEQESRKMLREASPKLKDIADEDLDKLAKFCGKLPLALRVAASLLNERRDWSIANLLSRLEDEYKRLEQLSRDDDIQLNVEATLALSYDLLDDVLKKYFRQLGIFTAPFLKLSAQAVWDLEDADLADDVLGKLGNRSLLNPLPAPIGTGADGETIYAYALHDLTRLYANQKLIEEKEYEDTLSSAGWHYLSWASFADDEYEKGNEHILSGLAQFRLIWPHLFSMYERLLPARKNRPDTADDWLSDFPGRCPYVLDLHLPPRLKIPIIENAMLASRRLGKKQIEGVHLGNLGNAYAALGDARKAIEFYEGQLIIVREIGDRRGEGAALGNLGLAYAALGDARKAIEFDEQSLLIKREIGDKRGEANSLARIGQYQLSTGNKEKAKEYWEKALEIFRAIESPHVKTVERLLAGLDGDESTEKEGGMTIQDLVKTVIEAVRTKNPQAGQLFEAMSKMAVEESAPPEIRELAKVLKSILAGVKSPDLSNLTDELAEIVREELG